MVSHTYDVLNSLESYLTAITDAETGTRGYVVTGDSGFLKPYYSSFEKIKTHGNSIKNLISDNVQQLKNWEQLNSVGNKRIQMLAVAISIFRNNNMSISDSLKRFSPSSNNMMDSVRIQVEIMKHIENKVLSERKASSEKNLHWLDIITFISLSLALAFIAFGFLTYQKEHKNRKEAYKKVQDYQDKLNTQLIELNKNNAELILMRSNEKFAVTGRIARQIAHEIRNPLTNINLASNQLKDDLKITDEDSLYLFDMINRNSERINNLVSDLLNSTKFAELNFSSCSVNDIMEDALSDAKDRIDLNSVIVDKNYDKTIQNLSLDRDKIKTVFTNLIINAIEACEKTANPKILLSTKNIDNKVEVNIIDNGTGLNDENLNKIFEPYFTTKLKGNGLGLTNTQNVILNHNGQISVTSKINMGTTFNIKLPIN